MSSSLSPCATATACVCSSKQTAVAVGAAVGDHEQQRLPPELEAALQHVDHGAVRMLVELVDQRHVRPRARTLAPRLARHRPEERARSAARPAWPCSRRADRCRRT